MPLSNIPLDFSLFPTQEGVYIVGGTTRDLLLGKIPVDYDIAVTQNPEIFAKKTADAGRGRLVRMGRAGKRSYRVVTGDTILDITGISGPAIRNDLERRDITINAMAVELSSGTLLDWVEGQRDLAEKRIRMVSEQCFRNDPIRLLRVFRLAAALGFSIEDQTVTAVARDAPLIRLSAGERIRSELCQLFSCRNSAPHVDMMEKTGLLRAIFPELSPEPTTGDTGPHDASLHPHFLPVYHRLETLLNHPPPGYPPQDTGVESSLPPDHAPWLKLAIILTRQNRGPNSWTAGRLDGEPLPDNHEKAIADAVEATCRRLRLSAKEKNFVTSIVSNHSRPVHLYDAYVQGKLTPTMATRFFMAARTLAPHLLLCALAEAQSDDTNRDSFTDFFRHMVRAYNETYLPEKTRPPFVSGRDLMRDFQLPPSPLLKRILTRLEEGRLSGELTDRAAALQMAEKIIREFKT